MSVDFIFTAAVLKTPQGFGLVLDQDLASGLVYLRSPPLYPNNVCNFEFVSGMGFSPAAQMSGLQPMDILLEVNCQPINGLPMATVQGILMAQPLEAVVGILTLSNHIQL